MNEYELHIGDCIESMKKMPDASVHTCITSPPYFGLRDYGVDGQIGLEHEPEQYIEKMVEVFREVRRVLRDDGTLWLNLGDKYAGRQLVGIPWRVAFALQNDGWFLRQEIIWHKTRVMPTSAKDRCTTNHEQIFMLTKVGAGYYYDSDAIRTPLAASSKKRVTKGWKSEKANVSVAGAQGIDIEVMGDRFAPESGANKRTVWSVCPSNFKGAHLATFPAELIEPCVLAGAPAGGIVLDPFGGSGTTAGVAIKHGRRAVLCELNPEYAAMIPRRVSAIVRGPIKGKKPETPIADNDNFQLEMRFNDVC